MPVKLAVGAAISAPLFAVAAIATVVVHRTASPAGFPCTRQRTLPTIDEEGI